MTKPKIIVVGAFPKNHDKIYGGIVTSCRALLDSSFSTRYSLELLDSTQASNPAPRLSKRALLALKRTTIFFSKIVMSRPDAVLVFCSDGPSLLEKGTMVWIAKTLRIPSLLFPRAGRTLQSYRKSRITRALARYSLTAPDIILCQGTEWVKFFEVNPIRSKTDVKVINNWTATEALLSLKKENPGHILEIIYVGWIVKEKGINELLKSFSRAASEHNIRLTLIGDGNFRTEAYDYVQRNELSKIVHFTGWLNKSDITDYYAKSDIFVLPSWSEGFPNALIEAMATRTACITTMVGSIPSLLTDNVHAALIPPKNEEALYSALTRLISDPEQRKILSLNGREFARNTFSVEKQIGKIASAIDDAIYEHKV